MSDTPSSDTPASDGAADDEPLLSVRGLEKHYPVTRGLLRREVGRVRAVDGVDLEVRRGEAVALVGESGCGKSTAARTLLHLEAPTGGEVRFDGDRVGAFDAADLRAFRRRAQLLWQNADEAFNPRVPVGDSVAEPMAIHGDVDPERREAIVADRLERVGIDPGTADRYPHEFSGGQKQRLSLARALVFDPDLLVADEPTSALDERVQGRVLALLSELQERHDLGILFISHDVRVVRRFCDRVAVMYLGEIVERGPVESVLGDPQHPYTQALVDAVPTLDPADRGVRNPLSGEVPDPADPPSGCRFHTRCPAIVPPEGMDVETSAYRGVVDLRLALTAGEVDVASIRERLEDSGGSASSASSGAAPDEPMDERLRRRLRERYEIPDELGDGDAEADLSVALDRLVDGDPDAALDRLEPTFVSVCEREPPAFHDVGAGEAACHHLR